MNAHGMILHKLWHIWWSGAVLLKLLLLQQMPTAAQNGNICPLLSTRRSVLNKLLRGKEQSKMIETTSELKII